MGGVSSGSIIMKAAAALGSFGGTNRFTCLKTPPLGSFSIKLRKTLSFAIHLLCSHIVSPGGGSTPFTITSPTSPSACADTTSIVLMLFIKIS